ncbi:MAG: hypothetical protein JXA62_03785 [Candidatus Aminicenantes bacterium]|nr:hypothetical protein [Candidatus Aminicenantes bacterium]
MGAVLRKLVITGCLCLAIMITAGVPAGQDEVLERVEVMNREIIVRIFAGGEPVSGLTRDDFMLTENGRPAAITSCRQVTRTLAPADMTTRDADESMETKRRGRLFLFLLWWNEETRDWPKAWKYFRENILRPGDRVILATDRRGIQLQSIKNEKEKLDQFLQEVSADLKNKKQDKDGLTRELQDIARDFHEMLSENARRPKSRKIPERILLDRFKGNYRGSLEEYRLKRLRAHPQMLQQLATALRAVDTEKWALVFLQNERLPLVDMQSSLLTHTPMDWGTREDLRRFIEECDRRMRMASGMIAHVRDLRSLFIGAGATFHLFLSDAIDETLGTNQLRWLPVFSSWESAFRGIVKDTGGAVQDTTRLRQALEKAASQPDIRYVLTYKPGGPAATKPRLKIEVSRPGLKVIYARKLLPREIRPLKLSAPAWKAGTLRFNLADYLRESGVGGTVSGDVHVKVSTETPKGESLEFEKVLHPVDDAAQVEMKLNFPEPGDYILTVAVRDRLSGNTALGYTRVSITPPKPKPQPPMDPQLRALLDKAAAYCRRLQRAAIRFTCTEVVEEMVLERNPLSKRMEPEKSRWHYNYQVVADRGEVVEQRHLVRREHRKVDVPKAKLETRFKALYPVFLPVTLLGAQNRENYLYLLEDTERFKKRSCAVIMVTPRLEGEGPLARGRAWVDMENGSVLKIEMDPRGVVGSAALEAAAKEMSAELDLNVVHWYLEERRGLRFPSSAEFSESYVFDKQVKNRKTNVYQPFALQGESHAVTLPTIESRYRRVEFYRVTQAYKNYRYFEVDTRVEIADPE